MTRGGARLRGVAIAALGISLLAAGPVPVRSAAAKGRVPHDGVATEAEARSACLRHRVVWSGGVAWRERDRIGRRPVRSRWDAAGESRIRCAEGTAFKRSRVADDPERR